MQGANLTSSVDAALTTTGSTIDTNGFNAAISGAFTGNGALTKVGLGTLTLSGANTYSGGTTISGGTLQIGNGGLTGSIVGNVLDNANLAFNRSDVITFSGNVSGTGTLSQRSAMARIRAP